MNIYKYQILKYLENQNIPIKDIKILPKDEILKLYNHVNLNDLKIYLNKRKSRKQKQIIHIPEKVKITIDWNDHFLMI